MMNHKITPMHLESKVEEGERLRLLEKIEAMETEVSGLVCEWVAEDYCDSLLSKACLMWKC